MFNFDFMFRLLFSQILLSLSAFSHDTLKESTLILGARQLIWVLFSSALLQKNGTEVIFGVFFLKRKKQLKNTLEYMMKMYLTMYFISYYKFKRIFNYISTTYIPCSKFQGKVTQQNLKQGQKKIKITNAYRFHKNRTGTKARKILIWYTDTKSASISKH